MNKHLAYRILSNLEEKAYRRNDIEKVIELSKAASRIARGN